MSCPPFLNLFPQGIPISLNHCCPLSPLSSSVG
ncbi:hypothetical protein M5D96_002721 [Drosophila gunungcola]|uniref:Uncharacterized protein n=1 Tax=Drosophila gunungcola TaxID=103775 RepID=A0A9P9Z0G6_9MUSC|nr:hypothetical protein M5D96_002721 [Drosophila gunungcola]